MPAVVMYALPALTVDNNAFCRLRRVTGGMIVQGEHDKKLMYMTGFAMDHDEDVTGEATQLQYHSPFCPASPLAA